MLQQKIAALKKKLEGEYQERERVLKDELTHKEQEFAVSLKAATENEKTQTQRLTAQFETYSTAS